MSHFSQENQLKDEIDAIDFFEFTHYRDLLLSCYERVKTKRKSYSYEKYSQELGLSMSNVAWLIINSKRKLTMTNCEKIIATLNIKGAKRRYLKSLVIYNNTKNVLEKKKGLENLLLIKKKALVKPIDRSRFAYFSEWYYPLLRELVGLEGFSEEPSEINKQLLQELLPAQIEEGLTLLQQLGLIRKDEDTGKFVQTAGQVKPTQKMANLATTSYHYEMCQVAANFLSKGRLEHSNYNSILIRSSLEGVKKINQKIQQFCEDLMAIEEEQIDKADRIFQINIQSLPVSTPLSKKRKNSL